MSKFKTLLSSILMGITAIGFSNAYAAPATSTVAPSTIKAEQLKLDQNWDKVFAKSNKINHHKATFVNRFGITLAADVYEPKKIRGKMPALVVVGPFGAVKEQSSGLYAQIMAERGFITIAVDPSFTGESGGYPRNIASPDINTEDVSATIDFLSIQNNIDPNKIGVIGICGWGGIVLNAAAVDPRIKATVTSTMYDMSRVITNDYFDYEKDSATLAQARQKNRESMSKTRTEDYKNGKYSYSGGLPDEISDEFPQFVKDYFAYYKTERGYHPRSVNSNIGWTVTSAIPFMNIHLMDYAGEIQNPVLMIHGEKAHSRYFSEDTFKKLRGDNKELMIIPGANHIDLYDQIDIIPFDKIEQFFKSNLK